MINTGSQLNLPAPPEELAGLSRQLFQRIGEEIAGSGPMPFDRYMAMALYEPGLGYYTNGLFKFGPEGDFVTAPEQGSVFARALACYVERMAEAMGDNWTLLEIGAGSGILARDLLQNLRTLPARYAILETSGELRDRQRTLIETLPADLADRVVWLDHPPEAPFDGLILANEVLDALPVARFRWTRDGARELRVGLAEGALEWVETIPGKRLGVALEATLADLPGPLPVGFESEICVDLPDWLQTVTASLNRGAAVLIDYGYLRQEYYLPQRHEGTLVCHYRHRAHFDPFLWPGLCDISGFVDFTAVAEAADRVGLSVDGFASQSWFLLNSGALEVIEACADDRERIRLAGEIRRLTLPGEMGEKFKVMALGRGLDAAAGFFDEGDQRHRL